MLVLGLRMEEVKGWIYLEILYNFFRVFLLIWEWMVSIWEEVLG